MLGKTNAVVNVGGGIEDILSGNLEEIVTTANPICISFNNGWTSVASNPNKLKKFVANNVVKLASNFFTYSPNLEYVELDKVDTIGNSCFNNCPKLETCILNSISDIPHYEFYNSPKLKNLILGNTTMVTIGSNPFPNATSSNKINVYVPANLIPSYQTATNWSTKYNNGYVVFKDINTWGGN